MIGHRRCRYYITKYLSFFGESSSASIASFHLIQSEHYLHSTMVIGSGSLRRLATMVEKHELTTVVVWSSNSPELV
jgi:50S ribosomal subunit-associated GTPase HflX